MSVVDTNTPLRRVDDGIANQLGLVAGRVSGSESPHVVNMGGIAANLVGADVCDLARGIKGSVIQLFSPGPPEPFELNVLNIDISPVKMNGVSPGALLIFRPKKNITRQVSHVSA